MTRKVGTVVGLPVLAILLIGGLTLLHLSQSAEQPIAFNHHLHIEDVGLECTDCHSYARSGARATIPNVDVCSGCHAEADEESPPEITKLVSYVESGQLIPWQKVYWVPDHVFFSHRRHTSIAGIECETCHGAIRESEKPLKTQAIGITMARCLGCHEESGASNDCIDCHR